MLLGLAIGDALGNTTESLLPERRPELYGEIRDYVPHRHKTLASPTDDTQLAFWTLDQMLADGGLVPEHVAKRFASERIFGDRARRRPGDERPALAGELPWYECGAPSAGNGALMRIAPMLVPFVRSPSAELWADTVLSAIVTHNDAASTSACVAFVAMLWQLLGMDEPPEPSWWRRTYVATARDLEGETRYAPRGGVFAGYSGPLWRFVDERLAAAEAQHLTALAACEQWWSGAYLLETVPSALYILARHAGDPEEALVRAVNDTKDNDTIAAIVGAAVGALHGAAACRSAGSAACRGRRGPTMREKCSGSCGGAGAVGSVNACGVVRHVAATWAHLRSDRHVGESDGGIRRQPACTLHGCPLLLSISPWRLTAATLARPCTPRPNTRGTRSTSTLMRPGTSTSGTPARAISC